MGNLKTASARSGYEKKIMVKANACELIEQIGYESVDISYTINHTYTPDFILYNSDGEPKILIEAKGQLRVSDRRKLRAVKAQHPELDIRLLFQRANNKLNSKSKTTYGVWAERWGIPWAEGEEIPRAWLDEVKREKV